MKTELTIATTKSIDQLIEELNTIRNTGSGLEISDLANQIEDACTQQNAETLNTRISELLAMEANRVKLFTEFINNPMYEVVRLKQNPKTGEYSIATGQRQISFNALEKAFEESGGSTLAQSKRYCAMLTYLVDNIAKNIAGELSEQVKKVSVPALTTKDERPTEYDFSGTSINALEGQLNVLVSTILPPELVIKMKRVDVKALRQAATTEKFMKFRMNKEGKMLDKIFSAMRIRMNDEAYELTSNAKAHKVSKKDLIANEKGSEKQEEIMSKVPERPEAAATLSKKNA